jgi:hypothetical protein
MADATMNDHVKSAFDISSFAIVGATLVEWLPAVAALLSIVWSLIRLWETATVKKWFKRH